jgi:hypothetical protein|tara:strand:+ start:189 stop:731 length:543 start_codon:yes stop_codon:yes gene_type:complete
MTPVHQPQMYQPQMQPMSIPQVGLGQDMHQLTPPKNRGWILAGGVHIVFMLSLLVYALVTSFFEPSEYSEGFAEQFYFSMQSTLYFFFLPTYVVTIASVLMASNVNCNKLLVVVLPPLSQIISLLTWSLIAATVSSEDSFSDAWDIIFGEDFFEQVIPGVLSHAALCGGLVMLLTFGSDK